MIRAWRLKRGTVWLFLATLLLASCSHWWLIERDPQWIKHDVVPKRILFIGDSHSAGFFGEAMRDRLMPMVGENNFYQYAVPGSSVPNWYQGDFQNLQLGYLMKVPRAEVQKAFNGSVPAWVGLKSLEGLLNEVNPQFLVVALGTNDAADYVGRVKGANDKGEQKQRVEEQLKTISLFLKTTKSYSSLSSSIRCVWVMPPAIKNKRFPENLQLEFYQQMRDLIRQAGCTLVDSLSFKADEGADHACYGQPTLASDLGDQLHFSKIQGSHWGRCSADEVAMALGLDANARSSP